MMVDEIGAKDGVSNSSDSAEAAPDQAAFPLFYTNPVPLSLERHGKKKLVPRAEVSFAATTNAIPINLAEFAHVSRHYPIAFVAGANPFPVAVVGMRSGENLFVEDDGLWRKGLYVPAYVRRFPFILVSGGPDDSLTLGIDEGAGALSDDEGIAVFDEKGQPSEQTLAALNFCQSYHNAVSPTQGFVNALNEKGLLVERQANIMKSEGPGVNLTGFHVVDSEKLKQLSPETLKEWWGNGWLQAITAHQISSLNWGDLADLC